MATQVTLDTVWNPDQYGAAYVVIPWKKTENVFNRWMPITVYSYAETTFLNRRMYSEILKFVDGSTAYKVPQRDLIKMNRDANGPYLDLAQYGRFRFQFEDPRLETQYSSCGGEWTPVS